jgi:putative protease
MNRKEIEIMAPVGSFESLQAAIQGGANSVYFGIEHLNMRSRSSANFSTEDLKEIVRIAQENKLKTYLTITTVMYDQDLGIMRQIIDTAKASNITAIIVSDQAALSYAYEQGVEIHLSTQLNVSNYETLKFYAHFSDVVVLARELNLEQVAEIYRQIREDNLCGPKGELIRIEMFVHGALCMAVSGKCYLSLHEKNASANRGACTQICRRGYDVKDKELGIELELDNQYIMSPKDLKTIHFLNKVLDCGVRVLKIEGRARSAEYVKTVTQCYSEAVESFIDETFTEEKITDWDTRLSRVFNRGFWNGYYLGQRLGEWSHNYGSSATHKRVYIGKVTNFFGKLMVAETKIESFGLSVGEDIIITGDTTGVIEKTVEDIRLDLKSVKSATKGDLISIHLGEKVRRGDKIYKMMPVGQSSVNSQ